MTRWITTAAVLVFACAARGGQTVGEFSWSRLQAAGRVRSGRLVDPGKGGPAEALAVENTEAAPASIPVLTIERPKSATKVYALHGQVKYEGVEGRGYLEMWNCFPGGCHFSKTLAASGPMRRLEGSSAWRRFVLPFRMKDAGRPPEKLMVNVVLPGRGTVVLGPMTLVEYAEGEDPLAAVGPWWTGRQGGWIGGVCGAVFGCLGGLVGYLSRRGRARGFVMASIGAMLAVGAAGLGVGMVALAKSQPFAVVYPPLLVGVLLVAIPLGLLRGIRKRYREVEMRKMQALDAS